jgi:rRNA maturation endonuclease Nob1
MTAWFRCSDCNNVLPLVHSTKEKCPCCGGARGVVIIQARVKEGVEVNNDPKAGKGSKKKPHPI